MNNITRFINDFIADESGLTAVEYAIAGGLVVGGLVIAFTQLGTAAQNQIVDLCKAADSEATCDGTTGTPAAGG
ncbi:Flp family type IVb pilin [Pseudoalteromonas sp.]|uniref:Flp family type IVb pilin n=1 Tax=Pseudoalteromonas sp. TaxID=53249 RepID=UPI00356A7E03